MKCRARRLLALVAGAPLLVGCGADGPAADGSPGYNGAVGQIKIRYARLAPAPPGAPFQPGSDVPLYLTLLNEGDRPDALVGARSAAARDVALVDRDGQPLPLPLRLESESDLYQLGPDGSHLLLRGITKDIRGGDPAEVTLRFERAGEHTFTVQSRIPRD